MLKKIDEHLCNSCTLEYPDCPAGVIEWGIDRNPKAIGAEADLVLRCNGYKKKED